MPNLIPVSLSLWAGIYNVCFAFRVGAPVVLMERFDPARSSRGSSPRYEHPLGRAAAGRDGDVLRRRRRSRRSRHCGTSGASPRRSRRSSPGGSTTGSAIAVLNCYGQTELGGEVVGWSAADWREFGATKLGAVGRPHAGVEVRVDDDGELWVRTPASRQSTAALGDRVDADGWVRTGDCGRVDDDGFVWIDGRVSDMVNRGGLKVFPAEVEEVLRAAPGVDDVAVVGVPDERLGEVPVAFVVGALRRRRISSATSVSTSRPYKVPVRVRVRRRSSPATRSARS